jgi:hypothetical protein
LTFEFSSETAMVCGSSARTASMVAARAGRSSASSTLPSARMRSATVTRRSRGISASSRFGFRP